MCPLCFRRIPILASAVAVAAALGGCPGEVLEGEAESSSPVVSRGIVWAASSRYIDGRGNAPFDRFLATAMFARYDQEQQDLFEELLVWRVDEPDLGLDTCGPAAPVLAFKQQPVVPGQTAISLLDAGTLTLSIDDRPIAVPTRTFPDLLKVVDGVMYSADESRGARFVPGATYSIRSAGTDLVGPFEVVLEAPDDLGDIKLDGLSPLEQIPVVRRGEDLEIAWEGSGWGDEVIAEFTWTSLGLPWSMVCRMRDNGLFIVPGERTRSLQDPLRGGDEELTISRIRQVAFRGAGLSGGTFAFVVAAHFPVRFEGPG